MKKLTCPSPCAHHWCTGAAARLNVGLLERQVALLGQLPREAKLGVEQEQVGRRDCLRRLECAAGVRDVVVGRVGHEASVARDDRVVGRAHSNGSGRRDAALPGNGRAGRSGGAQVGGVGVLCDEEALDGVEIAVDEGRVDHEGAAVGDGVQERVGPLGRGHRGEGGALGAEDHVLARVIEVHAAARLDLRHARDGWGTGWCQEESHRVCVCVCVCVCV